MKNKPTQQTASEIKIIKEHILYNLRVTLENTEEFYKTVKSMIKANKGKNLKLSDYDKLVKKGYDLYVKKYVPVKSRKYVTDAVIRAVSKSLRESWAEKIAFDKKHKK